MVAIMFEKLYDTLSTLPVVGIADQLTTDVCDGLTVILSSATGSGKTLVATCKLADKANAQVVVCVPRRFLAVNAAETICELAGLTLGNEVGYAVGKQSGEQSKMSADTKLLFVTYGYAISSRLIERAMYVINDEVHEASMDMSIVRALLLRRLAQGQDLCLMEMSATIDPVRQASYWNAETAPTKVYEIDGRTFPCLRLEVPLGSFVSLQGEGEEPDPEEFLHDFAELKALENAVEATVAQTTIDLINNHDRKGILIFRPGAGEVEATAEAIKALVKRTLRSQAKQARKANKGLPEDELNQLVNHLREENPLSKLEVVTIYGEMDYATRHAATQKAKDGYIKVLVGTNVVESGVNIPWLDGGVSCGTGKQQVVRESGALSLELVNLSQWRLEQQEGRVKRFCPGVFVLCSDEAWDTRMEETSPEITRVPLTELVMHCAGFGVRANSLTFDYVPDITKVEEAEVQLQNLGLLDQGCFLTESGKFTSALPVSTETGAMLWYAQKVGVLGDAVTIAALMEVGGIRKDFRYGHGYNNTSDWFDALLAYQYVCGAKGAERKELFEQENVSAKRFYAAKEFERDLLKHFNGDDMGFVFGQQGANELLVQAILVGQINKLCVYRSNVVYTKDGEGYRIGRGSTVQYISTPLVSGTLRKVNPRNGNMPFTVLEKVTQITLNTVMEVAKIRPELLCVVADERPTFSVYSREYIFVRRTMFNGLEIYKEEIKPSGTTVRSSAHLQSFGYASAR